MKQCTWPAKSDSRCFAAPSFTRKHTRHKPHDCPQLKPPLNGTPKLPDQYLPSSSSSFSFTATVGPKNFQQQQQQQPDFSLLPYDVLGKIAATFTVPDLRAASLVCRGWRDALRPLREAMLFLRWGKRFKHGRGGVKPNLSKALDSFLKGALRGSTLAMVDVGLLYWEIGKKEEGISWYLKAAELGDIAGQCNLGISYLKVDPPNNVEAFKWLYKSSIAGHVRAQYQLALCLHQGRVVNQNLNKAARLYLQAAEGGYVRAMYNTALCYLYGEGLEQSRRLARKWMKRAADCGHGKAQLEHGLHLFSEGQMMMAVVYLELAHRAGEMTAVHVKNAAVQRLSGTSHDQAMHLVSNWRALPSSH